jgi:hypothetical protein
MKTSRRHKNQRVVIRGEAMPQTGRVIAGLVIALGLAIAWTPTALSQNRNQSSTRNQQTDTKSETLKSISGTTVPKNSTTYTVRFEDFSKYQGRIDVTSDGTWRVIRFNDLPPQVSLVVAEKSPIYPAYRQAILPQQWYPFKNAFPFIVSFDKTVELPVEISYELSTVKMPPQGLPATAARIYVSNPDNVAAPQFRVLKIRFEGITPAASATPGATSFPGMNPPATSEDQLFPSLSHWVMFAIGGGLVLLLVFVAASTKIFPTSKKLRREPTKETEDSRPLQQGHAKNTPPLYYDLEGFKRDIVVHQPERRRLFGLIPWPWRSREKARNQVAKIWDEVAESPATKFPWSTVNVAPKSDVDLKPSTSPTLAAWPRPETPRPQNSSPFGSREPRPLDRETSARLKKIEESLEDLRHAHRALADHVQRALDPERGLGHDVKKELNALREELKNHFKEESKALLEDIGKQQGQINKSKQSGLVT